MLISDGSGLSEVRLSLVQKIWNINWTLVLLICLNASIGFAMLYSVAGGSVDPWVKRQAMRFAMGLGVMFVVSVIDIRIWLRYAYVIYGVALALLASVEFIGSVGMGAQRWVDIGFFQLQPSELMKISLVLALARYFHGLSLEDVRRLRYLAPPLILVLAPVALVLRQPDLGTAILLLMGAGALFLVAGVRLWIFGGAIAAVAAAGPFAWNYLRGYQQARILTFLNPERDPLGAGYHILQSKIALGSGGLTGRGYMQGTQSYLNFLPEKQTDFIFTSLAEEFGLAGALSLLGLYVIIIAYGIAIALRARNHFGRLLAMGVTATFFLYVFINIAMVTGLVPVVGVPLPLISYGGTAMVTILIGFGLLISVYVHRDVRIPRRPGVDL
jgi:rod shape determining protein RodA